ncbi:hypothetical protein JCM8547_000131 [Rhodosporidiobolus lusitaniae]
MQQLSDVLDVTPPAPSRASPRLPYDVLRLLVQEAGRTSQNDRQLRAIGGAFSLVCRDLRDDGQRLVWQTLAVPSFGVSDLFKHGSDHDRARLSGMVRALKWDEKRAGGRMTGTKQLRTYWREESLRHFREILRLARQLMKVALFDLPRAHLEEVCNLLASSPSAPCVTLLTIRGYLPLDQNETIFAQQSLLPLLRRLSALQSLDFSSPSISSLAAPDTATLPAEPFLRLQCVIFDNDHVGPVEKSKDGFPFSSLRRLLTAAIDPSVLVHAILHRYPTGDGWLRWISSPAFTSLTHLDIQSEHCFFPPSFPLIPPYLAPLPHLTHFAYRNLTTYIGIDRLKPAERAVFSAFLLALPPSLEVLLLDFCCPIDDKPSGQGRPEDKIAQYLWSPSSRNLQRFKCRTWLERVSYTLSWDVEEKRYEETYTNISKEDLLPW